MIITSWNIRGLNSKGKQRYLKERLRKDKPRIVIIQETNITQQQMERIIKKLKIQYEVMGQDAIGTPGGLAIMWNPEELIFENWTSLPRILTGSCRVIGSAESVLITGVYGPHIVGERESFIKNVKEARGL